MFRILLAFAAGYLYCAFEHEGSLMGGIWVGAAGIGAIMIRLLGGELLRPVIKRLYRQTNETKLSKLLTPVEYWTHHRQQHPELSYRQCSICHPHLQTSS